MLLFLLFSVACWSTSRSQSAFLEHAVFQEQLHASVLHAFQKGKEHLVLEHQLSDMLSLLHRPCRISPFSCSHGISRKHSGQESLAGRSCLDGTRAVTCRCSFIRLRGCVACSLHVHSAAADAWRSSEANLRMNLTAVPSRNLTEQKPHAVCRIRTSFPYFPLATYAQQQDYTKLCTIFPYRMTTTPRQS